MTPSTRKRGDEQEVIWGRVVKIHQKTPRTSKKEGYEDIVERKEGSHV